jgi:hypothetical protein
MSKKNRQYWDKKLSNKHKAVILVTLAPQESQELEESKSLLNAEKEAREREAQLKCAERRAKRESLKSFSK